jgi:hypothetical protein
MKVALEIYTFLNDLRYLYGDIFASEEEILYILYKWRELILG